MKKLSFFQKKKNWSAKNFNFHCLFFVSRVGMCSEYVSFCLEQISVCNLSYTTKKIGIQWKTDWARHTTIRLLLLMLLLNTNKLLVITVYIQYILAKGFYLGRKNHNILTSDAHLHYEGAFLLFYLILFWIFFSFGFHFR